MKEQCEVESDGEQRARMQEMNKSGDLNLLILSGKLIDNSSRALAGEAVAEKRKRTC